MRANSRAHRAPGDAQLKSIMSKRVPVVRVAPGQSATFALKKLKKNQLRKGMVLAGAALQVDLSLLCAGPDAFCRPGGPGCLSVAMRAAQGVSAVRGGGAHSAPPNHDRGELSASGALPHHPPGARF